MFNNHQIIFEDKDLIATYKPHGEHTLSSSNSKNDDSLCLYRLDECTSGILLYAKSKSVYDHIKDLQKENKIVKTYRALTEQSDVLLPSQPLNLVYKNKLESEVSMKCPLIVETYFRSFGEGRKAVRPVFENELKKIKNKDVTNNKYISYIVEFKRDTGKSNIKEFKVQITKGFRHQIRVHLATLGFPIVNDTMYGYKGQIGIPTHSIELECIEVKINDVLITL